MTTIFGYLEKPYLADAYLAVGTEEPGGFQFDASVSAERIVAYQFDSLIEDFVQHSGLQFNGVTSLVLQQLGSQADLVIRTLEQVGIQFDAVSRGEDLTGAQFEAGVALAANHAGVQFTAAFDAISTLGLQIQILVRDFLVSRGLQFQAVAERVRIDGLEFEPSRLKHFDCGGYLVRPYLVHAYLAKCTGAALGIQFEANSAIQADAAFQYDAFAERRVFSGTQFLGKIEGQENDIAFEFDASIVTAEQVGMQFEGLINTIDEHGFQFQGFIEDQTKTLAFQFDGKSQTFLGAQFRVVLYNTDRLRILCEFPSRGISGTNWTATSTEPGDFSVNNLNNDFVENKWRSASSVKTGIQLICDTEVPQGVFLDTFAMLNHNLSGGAQVFLRGSNDAGFAAIGFSQRLSYTRDNLYYISPILPPESFRYWRVDIEDSGNAEDHVSVGTIVFGSAAILQGDCFVNPIQFDRVDYADEVQTEGFATVANARALRKFLGMDFENIKFSGGTYETLQSVYSAARTVRKCLWVPTPGYPDRFAVFAKLVQIPSESHRDLGRDNNLISFRIEVDESR